MTSAHDHRADLVFIGDRRRVGVNGSHPGKLTASNSARIHRPNCVSLVGDEDAGATWAGKMFLLREHRDQLEETPARCNPPTPRARSTSRLMTRI